MVFIINEHVDFKARDKHIVPFPIKQLHTNDTVRIQYNCEAESINIRKLMHFFW